MLSLDLGDGLVLDLNDQVIAGMNQYLWGKIAEIPSKISTMKIAEHAEAIRVMPQGTPRPGRLSFDYTPNHRKPLNSMSPSSPIQRVRVMKGVQGGWSMVAECILAFYMKEMPADILFMSATGDLLERWASRRLEPMIDSYGIRKHIGAIADLGAKTRRTGDKTYSKEYFGVRMDMASARSAASMRATDKRILIRDETDGAPLELTTGEGNWLSVSEARTDGWGERRKIFDFSTPTTFENSAIYQLYLEGDQQKFLVPCPHCKKKQELEWGNAETVHGMKADTEAGRLKEAYYICDHCHEAIFNHHKTYMLLGGEWEPTAIPIDKYTESYHDSQIYRPVGMFSWTMMMAHYIKAQNDPEQMRSFVNLRLGMPFRESGARPKLENVIELRGGYREAEVPDETLFLTMATDVQTGSKNDPKNPPRIELEVLGHGDSYKTQSILYKRIEGEILNTDGGAWLALDDFKQEGGLIFRRSDGREFGVSLCFIDSGDGNTRDIVYDFCRTWNNCYPSKGFGILKRRRGEKDDEETPQDSLRYRAKKLDEDMALYEISTNFYKKMLYRSLKIERNESGPQKAGFQDFPMDRGQEYFEMLTAEEMKSDGSFYCPSGRRNEALDVRVYNMCAGAVYLNSLVQDMRLTMKEFAKENGEKIPSAMDLMNVNHRYVLDMLKKQTARV